MTLEQLLEMSLAEVIMLRNGLGEMNEKKEYFSFAAKHEEKTLPSAAMNITPGSKLEKVFNPGEWIDDDHGALADANSFKGFLTGQRGLQGRITVRNKGGKKFP